PRPADHARPRRRSRLTFDLLPGLGRTSPLAVARSGARGYRARMRAWAVYGVALPFGDEPASWWIDGSGAVHDRPVAGAELLPGGFVLPGLVDAHAHPAVGSGPAGPVPLTAGAARSNLVAWAQAGITLVRDVGSAGGLTLQLGSGPGRPALQAGGPVRAPPGPLLPPPLPRPG